MTREEAIEMLKKDKEQRGDCFISEALDMAIEALEQQEKTGKWIPLGNYDEWGNENSYKCSNCGERNFYPDNYCHNCGAKMVKPQESEIQMETVEECDCDTCKHRVLVRESEMEEFSLYKYTCKGECIYEPKEVKE